ncbi:MAG: phosphatidate cytidylyltransferase [Candidatus Pacearchaeota archaeon]|nr:phosphatidate cytidylyltransferase [Candidatus Pacearchaeota archaeon]
MEANLPFDSGRLLEKYHPDFAFAYGSGVFLEQAPKGSTQMDFVFGVQNPVEWHKKNLSQNRKDYSLVARTLGPATVASVQRTGAGIYYHSFVPFQDKEIKYGVISIDAIIDDLLNWTHLYVAGRLQKPVHILKHHPAIEEAMKKNLEKAMLVSLVLLPEEFTERQLFQTIISLSYLGDSRMQFGVDPGKVDRIVECQFARLQGMYHPLLDSRELLHVLLKKGEKYQKNNLGTQEYVYNFFPRELSSRVEKCNISSKDFGVHVKQALVEIVKSSSTAQTLKGLFSTGISRSIRYVQEKLERARIKD